MEFVFYDTETTGIDTAFDQILQFGAIRTDAELVEIDRFEIRSRLLPWVVPSPAALRVTGITPDMLTDSSLASHYDMVRQLEDRLGSWSPAIFVGYNSINFDEELLRQAFFQTLHSPWLTSVRGNTRFDVLTLARACSAYAPNAIAVPIDENGKRSFRLEVLAPANGYDLVNAHDALADVGATIHMAKLIKDRAPNVWDRLLLTSRKADTLAVLEDEEILFQTEFFFNSEYSWLVTQCGQNPEYDAQVATFDLANDPEPYLDMSVEALIGVLNDSPKVIRSVRANAQPVLMPFEGEKPNLRVPDIPERVARERARMIRRSLQFQKNIGQALSLRFEGREPAAWPEKQIYDGFPEQGDQRLMAEFHSAADWADRLAVAMKLSDQRLKHFAYRTIYSEAPDVLTQSHRHQIEVWLHERVLGQTGEEPWTTLPKAVVQAEELARTETGVAKRQMVAVRDYLRNLVQVISAKSSEPESGSQG